MAVDPFSKLAPSSGGTSLSRDLSRSPAHARPRERRRGRVRIGLGAAVVLLLTALAVAAVGTAVGQLGHSVDAPASGGTAGSSTEVPASGASAEPTGMPTELPAAGSAGAEPEVGRIFVHVLGSVQRPGLFEVSEGARVVDAIAAAGGLSPTADQAGVNLARPVADGEQLYVPAQGEVPSGPPAASSGDAGSAGAAAPGQGAAKVNLNTATLADLDTLPRIGPAMAQRILDYREANGRFAKIEDLQNVTGVGEKTFAGLQDLIVV